VFGILGSALYIGFWRISENRRGLIASLSAACLVFVLVIHKVSYRDTDGDHAARALLSKVWLAPAGLQPCFWCTTGRPWFDPWPQPPSESSRARATPRPRPIVGIAIRLARYFHHDSDQKMPRPPGAPPRRVEDSVNDPRVEVVVLAPSWTRQPSLRSATD